MYHLRASGNRETPAEEVKNTGVSSLKAAVNNERRRKGKEQTSSSVPTGKGRTDDKRSTSPEARPATGAQSPCQWGARCRKSSCDYRHPLVCRNYKSGNRCIHGNNIACIDMLMVRRNPAGGRQVRLLKEKLRF